MWLSHLTWEPPPLGLIRINVDAAVSSSTTASLTQGWRDSDKVIKVQLNCIIVALLSKLKLLHSKGYVLFEGDSKGCLDTLISKDLPPDWSINNVISNIINISESCLSFSFRWVKPVCATLWLIQQQRLLFAPTCLFVSMMIIFRQILSLLIRVDYPPFPLV